MYCPNPYFELNIIYMCMYKTLKKNSLNDTLVIDLPFQTLVVDLVEFITLALLLRTPETLYSLNLFSPGPFRVAALYTFTIVSISAAIP